MVLFDVYTFHKSFFFLLLCFNHFNTVMITSWSSPYANELATKLTWVFLCHRTATFIASCPQYAHRYSSFNFFGISQLSQIQMRSFCLLLFFHFLLNFSEIFTPPLQGEVVLLFSIIIMKWRFWLQNRLAPIAAAHRLDLCNPRLERPISASGVIR